ncbi:MAG: box helicase [Nitrospira sp.]|jgi:type I restriction enzyme R subunit|nr:box helicase [Nitrospira sp.]
MTELDKKSLSERDICSKFITPAVRNAGWDELSQVREQVYFTKGRIIVRGKLVTRGKAKFADYILYYKPNIPIALIEAKDNNHSVGDGMQQGLEYTATLDIPFVFSSNGDAFLFHDRTGQSKQIQQRIVAKVDELMALCDRLEAQLTTTQTESRRLLESVLHEAISVQSGLEQ